MAEAQHKTCHETSKETIIITMSLFLAPKKITFTTSSRTRSFIIPVIKEQRLLLQYVPARSICQEQRLLLQYVPARSICHVSLQGKITLRAH